MKVFYFAIFFLLLILNLPEAKVYGEDDFFIVKNEFEEEFLRKFNEKPDYIIFEQQQEEIRVFGLRKEDVLMPVYGEQYDNPCGKPHIRNDMANRWCHALWVKTISKSLQQQGMNKYLADILGASYFLPKEYIFDKKPSMGDLVLSEVEVYHNKSDKTEDTVTVTIFGDGVVYINYRRRF